MRYTIDVYLYLYLYITLLSTLFTILSSRVFVGPYEVVAALAFRLCTCIELSTLVSTFLCHCQPVFNETDQTFIIQTDIELRKNDKLKQFFLHCSDLNEVCQ